MSHSANSSLQTFSQYDLVTLTPQGSTEPVTGFIATLTGSKVKIVFAKNDDLRQYQNKPSQDPSQLFSSLKVKPHAGTATASVLQDYVDQLKAAAPKNPPKKGAIVSFTHGGKLCTGRVLKGGKNPSVSFDEHHNLTIHFTHLRPAELLNPDPELKDWSVLNYQELHQGPNGPVMKAKIAYKGRVVIEAYNGGYGGPDELTQIIKGDHLTKFTDTLAQYAAKHGQDSTMLEDMWINYDWRLRATGITFASYLNSDD